MFRSGRFDLYGSYACSGAPLCLNLVDTTAGQFVHRASMCAFNEAVGVHAAGHGSAHQKHRHGGLLVLGERGRQPKAVEAVFGAVRGTIKNQEIIQRLLIRVLEAVRQESLSGASQQFRFPPGSSCGPG